MKDQQEELTIGEIISTLAAGLFFVWVLILCSSIVLIGW